MKREDRYSDAELREVRRRLQRMPCDYKLYMNRDPAELGSIGMVASYKIAVSTPTNRTSDHTANAAMRLAVLPKNIAIRIAWLECAWRVFARGRMTLNEPRPIVCIVMLALIYLQSALNAVYFYRTERFTRKHIRSLCENEHIAP